MASSTQTAVEVCNVALLFVGNGQTINDFDEDTQEARSCTVYFPKARDALLQTFPWKFATKRSVLALLAGEERTGWDFTYAWPADCLTPRFLHPAKSKLPFDVESLSSVNGDVAGRCIVTNAPDAELVYTAQVATVALYPPLFVDALAWALAMKLALILPIKPDLAMRLEQKAMAAFNRAASADLRAAQDEPAPPSEYTTAR